MILSSSSLITLTASSILDRTLVQPDTLEEIFATQDRLHASLFLWGSDLPTHGAAGHSTFDRLLGSLGQGNLAVLN